MTVLRTQLHGVARRPARLLLTGLAVIVAAFFAFATVLAQQVTERALVGSFSDTPAATSVVVTSASTPLPPATLARIRAVPGVAEAAGRVGGNEFPAGVAMGDVYFSVTADPGSGPLSVLKTVSGSYPDARGEVAVSERTAVQAGLAVGSKLSVTIMDTDRPIPLLVTAVVQAPDDHGLALYAPDTVAAAALRTGFSRIDVRAGPGASTADLIPAIAALMPAPATSPGTDEVESSGATGTAPQVRDAATVRAEEAQDQVDELEQLFALLGMFVLIAVIAAALVATSTFRIVFAQRMRQLALLRAVGAGRGRLAGALTVEGAVTGLVAGVVGVVAAFALGHAVTGVLNVTGHAVPAPLFPVGWVIAIVLGAMLVTLLAVLAPAVSAAKVSPLEALRTSSVTGGTSRLGWPRIVFGALTTLLAAGTGALALLAAHSAAQSTEPGTELTLLLLLIVLSGTAAFGSLLAFGPVIVGPLVRLLGAPIRRTGAVGQLAVGGVGGMPRRAAAVCAVVALGVTLVAGVLVGSDSLRTYADAELAAAAPADLQITGTDGAPLPAGAAERLAKRTELTRVTPYRNVPVRAGQTEGFDLSDADLSKLPGANKLRFDHGSLADIGPGRIGVGASMTDVLGAGAGDRVTLMLGARKITVTVATVIGGTGPLGGATLLADPADLDRLGAPRQPTGVLADVPGDRKKAVEAARAALHGTNVQMDLLAEERDLVNSFINGLTGVALGLLGLTVIIAVVGVGTTTALSVVERTRESGMLRAVGLSRAGLRATVAIEAGLYGVVGSALGLVLGVPYAWLTVYALDLGAPLVAPVAQLAAVVVVLAGLTILAGLLPARRAARVSPVAALAVE